MVMERRGYIKQYVLFTQLKTLFRRKFMEYTKQFDIPKQLVLTAYKQVKANAGSAGVDCETIKDFEKKCVKSLIK